MRLTRRMPGTWLGRRSAMLLRRIALMTLRRPVDDVIYGRRMRLYPFNNVCEKRVLFTPQFFDPVERAILSACATEDFVFIDIGANVGLYSLFVAGLAPRGQILAVEPQPDMFERLLYNIAQNDAGTIKALRCALADREGELTLFVEDQNRGESSIKFLGSEEGSGNAIKVPARTLLGVIREEGFARIDAIKIDVEGAEDLVMTEFLEEAPEELLPSLIIIENAQARWQVDLIGLMEKRGYHVIATTRLNLVLEKGIVHRPDELLQAVARGGSDEYGKGALGRRP
ncbi:FkbM family methyltransferase [Lutibaculum baratangense]